MSPGESLELFTLKDVLQTIGDVKGETSTFAAVCKKLNDDILKNSEIFVFELNIENLSFGQVFPSTNSKVEIKVSDLTYQHDHQRLQDEVVKEAIEMQIGIKQHHQVIVRPIYSLGILRALVLVQHPGVTPDDDRRILFINTLSRTFLWILERDRLLKIFREVQVPINFKQSEADYFSDIMKLVRSATQMPFIAIREYSPDEKSLRCISQSGFNNLALNELDLEEIGSSRYNPFYQCLNTQRPVNVTHYEDCPEIFDALKTHGVKSFLVVPVLVGINVFGTLSFACGIENYEFSMLETAGFVAIAHAVGLSITNFRNFHRLVEDERDSALRDMALVAVEIAQHARHEARNHIEEGHAILKKLTQLVRKVPGAENLSNDLKKKFGDLNIALDRIKEATAVPSEEISLCQVANVWRTSLSDVQYKLDTEHIRCSFEGNAKDKAAVLVSSDHLRLTFSQLVLNSIDAFHRQGSKVKNKQIKIEISDPSPKANSFIIKYSDNAGGIDPSRLRRATQDPSFFEPLAAEDQKPNAIFKRGVTSKGKQGSGYGLFLARKTLSDMEGSIDLIEYRGGTTIFEITLPKPDLARAKAIENAARLHV
jgi:signal transduction histidine kinase